MYLLAPRDFFRLWDGTNVYKVSESCVKRSPGAGWLNLSRCCSNVQLMCVFRMEFGSNLSSQSFISVTCSPGLKWMCETRSKQAVTRRPRPPFSITWLKSGDDPIKSGGGVGKSSSPANDQNQAKIGLSIQNDGLPVAVTAMLHETFLCVVTC